MKNRILYGLLFVSLLLFAVFTLEAKRRPPKSLEPLKYNDWLISSYCYDVGYGIQIDKGDAKERIRLYTLVYAKGVELDAQFDYINFLTIIENVVIVSTEKGCVFSYNIDDKSIAILNKPKFYEVVDLQKVKSPNKDAIILHCRLP